MIRKYATARRAELVNFSHHIYKRQCPKSPVNVRKERYYLEIDIRPHTSRVKTNYTV